MRDGRRKRLGLQEGTEGTVGDAYLDRILSNEDIAGETNILNIDPDANVRTTDNRYVQDAYNYYLGGGKGGGIDAAQIPGAIDTLVDVGGGGGQDLATSGLGLGATTPANTNFKQNLLDQGIGVQGAIGDPVVAPGEMPDTQETFDEFNQIPVNRESSMPQGSPGQLNPPAGDEMDIDNIIESSMPQGSPGQLNPPAGVDYSEFDDLEAQSAATDEILNSKDVNAEGELTQSGLDKFKSMFGENFNPLMAAGKVAFNNFIGAPVTLAFDALKAIGGMLPDRDPRQGALEDLYNVDGTKVKSGLMKDYNIVSGNPLNPTYGLQNAYERRLETINKALGEMNLEEYKNTDLVQRKIDLEKAMADEKTMLDQLQYGDPKEIATGIQTADDDSGSDMLGEITGPTEYDTADFGMTTTGINPFEETQVTSDLPTGELTEEQYNQALVGIDTDLTKDEVFYDERLGYVDAAGNSIDDPNAIGNITGATALVEKAQTQLNKIEALEKSDAYEFLSQEQKDQLQKDKEKIKEQLKTIPIVKKTSLNTINTSDNIYGPPIDEQAEADRIESQRRELQEINARAEREAAEQAARDLAAAKRRAGGGGNSGNRSSNTNSPGHPSNR